MMKTNILGTGCSVAQAEAGEDLKLKDCDGYTDTSIKTIVVEGVQSVQAFPTHTGVILISKIEKEQESINKK